MKIYLGKPFSPPTQLVFNDRKNEQDVTSMWGIAFGMTFLGVIRTANTRGPIVEVRSTAG